jgi:hypothetical protein
MLWALFTASSNAFQAQGLVNLAREDVSRYPKHRSLLALAFWLVGCLIDCQPS